MKNILRKYRLSLGLAGLAAILSNVAAMMTPLLLGLAIDAMVGKGQVDFAVVTYYGSWILLFYALQFIFAWILNNRANDIALKEVSNLRQRSNIKTYDLPMATLDQSSAGDISNLFALDMELVLEAWYQGLTQVLSGAVLVVLVSGFMLSLSVLMTVVVYVTVPIVYFSSKAIAKRSLLLFRRQQGEAAKLNGLAQAYISSHRLLMTYNYQNEAISRFEANNAALNEVGWRAQFISAIVNPTTRFVNNISTICVLLSGVYMISQGRLTVGLLTSFMSYALMFAKPFNEISAVISQISSGLAAYERISVFLQLKEDKEGKEALDLPGQEIELQDISFSYHPDYPLIEGLNLQVEPLSKIAIVGPTGAGKSTLINLLLRFYDRDKGTYLMDGHDTQSLTKKTVRQNMGMVLQEPWLFAGTIRENLALAREDASDAMILDVLRQIGAYDFVMNREGALDALIHPDSSHLSLGQMQLLTIARALLSDAPILILDEATSSVDILTEYQISKVFTQIMKSHTSFFIAHRLATVFDADLILVMNEGRLVEKGTHHELMIKQGFYYQMVMSQHTANE